MNDEDILCVCERRLRSGNTRWARRGCRVCRGEWGENPVQRHLGHCACCHRPAIMPHGRIVCEGCDTSEVRP